jgi:cellulose synthase/poly-beta-1,6-N-acetylglucosamine synthase-like glycosyltransferase
VTWSRTSPDGDHGDQFVRLVREENEFLGDCFRPYRAGTINEKPRDAAARHAGALAKWLHYRFVPEVESVKTAVLILCLASVVVATTVCAYHLFLALVAVAFRRRTGQPSSEAMNNFAIIIPAFNEENTIAGVLGSCAALDYPTKRFTVYVVADHCSDRTAEVAAELGAVSLVSQSETGRGKGHALEWAFQQIFSRGHDAVVVLDADCQLESHALREFDRYLNAGERVLQANNVVGNPDDSVSSCILALASILENDLFYTPKSILGLAVLLQGTGMVFRKDVLTQCPWRARSIVEDAEYSYRLLKAGVRVRFLPNVRVKSESPTHQKQLSVQRGRWIGGGISLARNHCLEMLWEGLVKRRIALIDAAWTAVIVSRPLILLQLLVTVVLCLSCYWLNLRIWSEYLAFWCLGIVVTYTVYVALGVALLGDTAKRVRFLLRIPLFVLQYLLLAVRTLASACPTTWDRTPRLRQVDPPEPTVSE